MDKAERTKQFIIEQAAPIFNKKGLAGATVNDILDITKMSKGGLYGRFQNKEEMDENMVDFLLQKLGTKVTQEVAKEKTAVKKIFAFLDVYKNPLTSYIDGGCPILNFGVESDDTNPVIKQKVRDMIFRSQKRLTDILTQGIENKEIAGTINIEEMSIKIFVILEGAMMMSRVTETNKYMDIMIDMLKKELKGYEL